MFVSRTISGLRGSGRNALDVPVAALAGLAVAFLAFAAPAGLLAELVGASGLASIIPAAEPPLGLKARLGIGAGGAVLVFAIAFLLLRWLDRFGTRRTEEAEDALIMETPRLRRRDIHPDAPARAPLLAVHELGEPELELNEIHTEAPAPWLEPASTVARDLPPEPELQATWGGESEPLREAPQESPSQADAYALSQRIWSEDPATNDSEAADDWQAEPMAREPIEAEGLDQPWPAEPTQSDEPSSNDDFGSADFAAPALPAEAETEAAAETPQPWPAACRVPEPEPAAESALAQPVPQHASGSIPDLMERLEQGLARRRFAPPPQPAERAAPEPRVAAEPDNDRLQSAIDSLQRFASRQD